MPIYTIYKSTNKITGKSYVGFTEKWPLRKGQHKVFAKTGRGFHFHNSIRKYGYDNFIWEVLAEHEDKELVLNEWEPFYIKMFDTYSNGYNQTEGGGGGGHYSPHSEETKRKISETKKRNPTRYWLGKKRTEKTKQKISEANSGRKQTEDHKRINSQKIKELWANPEYRKKQMEARRK